MELFFTSAIFKYIVFPIGSAVLKITIKFATRNDRYATFKKEDLAIGLDLITTACLMYVLLTTERAISLTKSTDALSDALAKNQVNSAYVSGLQKDVHLLSSDLTSAGWYIALMFLGLWGMSTIVRKWGWKSEYEMKSIIGIALPLAFGVLGLIVVMAGAVG